MSTNSVIVTKGLTKRYGDLVALAPLNLDIESGSRVTLVGSNGSGKTTLLRMLSGLLEPTKGTVMVDGEPAGSINARAALSYLTDNPVLYEDLSLWEHLEYVARLHDTFGWEERAHHLMGRLNLSHRMHDLPAQFSRGLRQKTAIALALIRPFEVMLIDEPFVGLDQPGKEALVELIDEAADDGATMVVATHQLEYVERSDRSLMLRDGELKRDGKASPRDVADFLGM